MELVSSIKDVKKLSKNSISIWGIQVSKYNKNIDNIYKILSKNEQSKANNFKNKNHARASVLARGALRILLGAYENSAPEELNFSKTKDGKPFLPNSRINFNPELIRDITLEVIRQLFTSGNLLKENTGCFMA